MQTQSIFVVFYSCLTTPQKSSRPRQWNSCRTFCLSQYAVWPTCAWKRAERAERSRSCRCWVARSTERFRRPCLECNDKSENASSHLNYPLCPKYHRAELSAAQRLHSGSVLQRLLFARRGMLVVQDSPPNDTTPRHSETKHGSIREVPWKYACWLLPDKRRQCRMVMTMWMLL